MHTGLHGGPAFPIPGLQHDEDFNGMSLRDYFAAGFAAAQATTTSADSSFINPTYVDPRDDRTIAQKIAESSYALADAMLAARVKP